MLEIRIVNGAKPSHKDWREYASVFELMETVPFVQELRDRHVRTVSGFDRVLDAGCGPGLYLGELARNVREVVGIDSDYSMLSIAAHRLRESSNVALYLGEVVALPFDDSYFDGVISNNVVHFLEDPDKFFREIVRVVKPNGVISISSARHGVSVEAIILAAQVHFNSMNLDADTRRKIELLADSNRRMLAHVKHLFESDQIAEKLQIEHGCSVISHEIAYVVQSFYVVAIK